jgi:hypothetical protein
MLAKHLLLVCCCLIVAGCSPRVDEESFFSLFSGEYVNHQVFTFEMLTINLDGTFTNFMWFDSGGAFTLNGKISLKYNDMILLYELDEQDFLREQKAIPIIWGDRKYLFYSYEGNEDIITEFCNGIADGSTAQKDDEGKLFFIFSHRNNPGASILGDPEYINGEKFCQ